MLDLDARLGTWPVDRAAAAVVTPTAAVTGGAVDHVFALASITKLVTAYAALIAVEEGTWALDTDLRELVAITGAAHPVRLDDTLAHAAGLAPDRAVQLDAPGRRRNYSTAGYDLIADALAEASGMPFAEYVTLAVLEPLGMATTTIRRGGTDGMAPLGDLVRFARELQRPTLLAPETARALRTVHRPGLGGVLPGFGRQTDNAWGLGPEIRGTKSPHWTGAHNAPATFGHFGQAGGCLWVDPVADVALVALTDRAFGPWAAAAWPQLSDAVLAQVAGAPGPRS